MTASIHQRVQARVVAQEPQAGTQTKTIILIIVARPIGNVPTNRDWTGCRIMYMKRPLYMSYRKTDIARKVMKRNMLRQKIANTTSGLCNL